MKEFAKVSFVVAQFMLFVCGVEYIGFLRREAEIAKFDCMMNRYHS